MTSVALTAAQAKAGDDLRAALAQAESALGESGVAGILDAAGFGPDEPDHVACHDNCPEPAEREQLDVAARLVHADHDRFSWQHCSRDVCRALRDV